MVGVVTNAIIYFIYLLITYFGMEPKTAMTLLYIVGASIGFIGHRKWTFAHRGNSGSAAVRYALAHLFGYFLNFLILFIFADHLGYAHQWVQAAAIIIVAGFLFVVFKYFVFRESVQYARENVDIGFKAHYFKELAEFEAGNFWFRARNNIILWALQKHSPELKSFLEIGCGTGFVISAISKWFPEAKLSGSEYFEEGLIYARQRVPSVEFEQMDARSIPYESEFDAIGAFDVLEHIKEDESVLQQMYKALKPVGFVFITVPQHSWLWSAVDEYACHVRRYGANELHEKVCSAGFEIIRSTSFVSTLLPAMYLSRLLQRSKTDMNIGDVAGFSANPILNKIFEWLLNFELTLIRVGVSFPIGGSRLLVARKRSVA